MTALSEKCAAALRRAGFGSQEIMVSEDELRDLAKRNSPQEFREAIVDAVHSSIVQSDIDIYETEAAATPSALPSKRLRQERSASHGSLASLNILSSLAQSGIIPLNELFDVLMDLQEQLGLYDTHKLCQYILTQEMVFNKLLEAQGSVSAQRLSRARLIALINNIEKKLKALDGSAVYIARFRSLLSNLLPKTFQGVSNRPSRDARAAQFQGPPLPVDGFWWGAGEVETEEDLEEEGEVGEASDSSSGSVRIGEKRRKTTASASGGLISPVKQKKGSSQGTGPSMEFTYYQNFYRTMALLGNPVDVLARITLGEALELVKHLLSLVQILKSFHQSSDEPSSLDDDWKDLWFSIDQAALNKRPPFGAFRRALQDLSFRRYLVHKLNAFIRAVRCKGRKVVGGSPQDVSSVFDQLPTELKTAINNLAGAVYRLLKRLPAVPTPGIVSVQHEGIPHYITSTIPWGPVTCASSLAAEFDSQEILTVNWKREGCNDPKAPSCYEPEAPLLRGPSSFTSTGFVPSRLVEHSSPSCLSAGPPTGLNTQLQERQNVLLNRFLPSVGNFDNIDINSPRFERERISWYLPPAEAQGQETVTQKLMDKFIDYKAKVISDDDPDNAIEEDEKVVRDALFQWRCHRLLNSSSLQLYDTAVQSKELRAKIRAANVEELLPTALKLSATMPVC